MPFAVAGPRGETAYKVLIEAVGIQVPVSGHVVLNKAQITMERLIHGIEAFKAGRVDQNYIAECAREAWGIHALSLTGKGGLLNKYLLGFRAEFSLKAHIATSIHIKHNQIGIPRRVYNDFVEEWSRRCSEEVLYDEIDAPYALAFRNPLLHEPSMRILDIRPTESNRVIIHPVITAGMNADSDGDLIEVILGHPGVRPEENWDTAIWDKEFLINNPNSTPDFDNIIEDGEKRLEEFIVLGPHDLINPTNSAALEKLCRAEDLNIEDLCAFFHGKTMEDIMSDDKDVAHGIILQKGEIGKAGAASTRARVLANGDPVISRAADIISERAQQKLFDSKHALDDVYKILIGVLKKDPKIAKTRADAERQLRECGIDPLKVAPYLNVLYSMEGTLNEIVDTLNPTYKAVNDPMVRGMEPGAAMVDAVSKIINMYAYTDSNELIERLKQRTLSSGEVEDVHEGRSDDVVSDKELQTSEL